MELYKQTLNIGKGFEQCLSAAEDENIKFYKLTGPSNTRFAAYFERSLLNFDTIRADIKSKCVL